MVGEIVPKHRNRIIVAFIFYTNYAVNLEVYTNKSITNYFSLTKSITGIPTMDFIISEIGLNTTKTR